jgi:anti-sigma regulatory factor (Ser/Thr protein kinase)
MDRWSISVPGVPSMVPVARLFVRAFLVGNPLADSAELITSEYATNAIRHTAAGEGGVIQVAVSAGPGLVRIEVTDHAPLEAVRAWPAAPGPVPQVTQAGEEDESGRGLLLVDAIADRWGHDGVAGHRTAWAEIRVTGGAEVAAGTG